MSRALALGCAALLSFGAVAQQPPAEPSSSTPAPVVPEAPAPQEPPRREERLDVGALPMPNYDSNFGFGLGLNVGLFWRSRGYQPYRLAVRAQTYGTSGGYQEHYLAFDAPNAFASPYRVSGRFAYVRDANRPFFGYGNVPEVPPADDPRWAQRHFEFDDAIWQLELAAQRWLVAPWKVGLRYTLNLGTVRSAEGSLLRALRPSGAGEGPESFVLAELVYDTRDREASPTRGVHAGLELYGSHAFIGSAYAYAGVRARAATYWAPFGHPALVLVGRVMGDVLAGSAPPRRMPGLGGDSLVRGIPRERVAGNARVVANVEARSRALRLRPWNHELDFWLVGFIDLGRVWSQEEDGPFWLWHPGYGAGLRIAWEQDYVVRFDVGFAPGQPLGVFLVFNHPF